MLVGSSLSRYTDRLLDVISDVVLNPTFPEDEIKLKKTYWEANQQAVRKIRIEG